MILVDKIEVVGVGCSYRNKEVLRRTQMSAKVKHIHLPYTTYNLCKKVGGVSSNKTHTNCKTCLKLYKQWKEMVKELQEHGGDSLGNGNVILKKYSFI